MEECEGKGKEVLVVMDTPERSKAQIATPERSKAQIATPISKFEESPVFNFLNSLSPIKPVKSVHITQTLNALSFSSLPSVFTSPHASSVRESRFLRRHQLVDPAKPEFSSDSQMKNDGDDNILDHDSNSKQQHNDDSGNSSSQVNVDAPYECSELTADFVRCLDYDCSSPASARGVKRVAKFNVSSGNQDPVPDSASGFGNERNMDEMCRTNQGEEPGDRDWESMIADASDLLNFDSPQDAYRKSPTPATGFHKSMPNVQQFNLCEHGEGDETENPSTQPGEGGSQENDYSDGTNNQKMDAEPVSHLYRGMRRRCLVFEMSGGRRKHVDEKASSTSVLLQSDGVTPSSDRQKHPTRARTDSSSSRCILPGIGLHLNALAAASKDGKNDSSTAGRLVITPVSMPNFRNDPESYHHGSLSVTSMEPNSSQADNGGLMEDLNQSSAMVLYDESNQNSNSPKMKKRKLESPKEPEACKRCNCKKSKCLKLYCECFAAGVYCVEPCSCQDCFNKPVHEDTVLATRKQIESRNPLAFAPKVIRGSNAVAEDDLTQTPASARHKRGCNCKKSGCLKRYCECYQGGVGCSINCRCEGCKNAFGRKDGSLYIAGMETEFEDEEMENDRNKQKVGMHVDTEHHGSSTPATPLRFTRPSILHPFSSKKKPPRSSLASIGTSAGVYSIPGLVKPPLLQPQTQSRFEKQFETVQEDDELPDILQGNTSPLPNIKSTSSPNGKRVSPPHTELGLSSSSPSRRSSRKLILQSIPAFPSLTPQH